MKTYNYSFVLDHKQDGETPKFGRLSFECEDDECAEAFADRVLGGEDAVTSYVFEDAE